MQLSSGLHYRLDPGSLNCFRSRDWNKHFPQRCNRELPWEARTGIAYHDQDSSLAVAAHQALFPAAFRQRSQMSTQLQTEMSPQLQTEPIQPQPNIRRWSPA